MKTLLKLKSHIIFISSKLIYLIPRKCDFLLWYKTQRKWCPNKAYGFNTLWHISELLKSNKRKLEKSKHNIYFKHIFLANLFKQLKLRPSLKDRSRHETFLSFFLYISSHLTLSEKEELGTVHKSSAPSNCSDIRSLSLALREKG